MSNDKNKKKSFRIDHTSEDGEELTGQFTTKRLSILDRARVGRRRSQLSGGMYCVRDDEGEPTGQGLDEESDFLATAVAHLEVSLIQKPSWWDLDDITDIQLLRKVYEEVMDFEWSFFRSRQQAARVEESAGGSSDDSGAKDASEQSGDGLTKVVGDEVLTALDA